MPPATTGVADRPDARPLERPGPAPTRHIPELDGYRGIGVLVVLLFHFDLLAGGWLGVDLFFVLSGFLITRIIVHERATSGRIDLRAFWRRRARRLLPALVVFLAGVAGYLWWYPDKVALPTGMTAQMWSTILYVANWQTIFSGGNYWSRFAAESPLRHMWSLSIEEQFYLLFPLVMAGLFAFWRRRLRIAWLLLGAALASWTTAVLLLALTGDFERVYLGTDTRIGAVLLGAGVGYLSCVPGIRERLIAGARHLVVPAALAVVAAFVFLDGNSAWSPARWLLVPGFEIAVVVLLTAALHVTLPARTATASGRREPLGVAVQRLVASPPLVWLGSISYGLYLWHVPVKLTVEQALHRSPRIVVVSTAVAISLVIATLSLHALERPIRRYGLRIAPRGTLLAAAALSLAASLVVTAHATAPARRHASQGSTPLVVLAEEDHGTTSAPPTETTATSATSAVAPTTVPPAQGLQLPVPRPVGRKPRILLLGDSLAFDLTEQFRAEAAVRGISASASSLVGCGLGGNRVQADGHPGVTGKEAVALCDAWIAGQVDLVHKVKPDVVLVLREGSRQPEPGDGWCTPRYLDWYRAALDDEITRLSSTGAAVVIAPLVYQRFGKKQVQESDDRTDCLNRTLSEVTRDDPRAATLGLDKWVCDDRDHCRTEENGVILRPDDLHFRGAGATIASRWLLERIFG